MIIIVLTVILTIIAVLALLCAIGVVIGYIEPSVGCMLEIVFFVAGLVILVIFLFYYESGIVI